MACVVRAITSATAPSDCIDVSGDGSVGNPITAAPIISADVGNTVECRPDGLYAAGGGGGGTAAPSWQGSGSGPTVFGSFILNVPFSSPPLNPGGNGPYIFVSAVVNVANFSGGPTVVDFAGGFRADFSNLDGNGASLNEKGFTWPDEARRSFGVSCIIVASANFGFFIQNNGPDDLFIDVNISAIELMDHKDFDGCVPGS